MRFRSFLLLGSFFLLSGCEHVPFHSKSHSYLNESNVVSPVASVSGAQLKQATQYYPVPPISNVALAKKTPSLVPPGSDLQRFAKKATGAVKKTSLASVENQQGETVVAIRENVNKAWKEIPIALSNTPYHVLDEDRSLSSFFVLDTLQTKQQITEKTPIYRLSLTPKGEGTVVEISSRNNKPVPPGVAQRILGSLAGSWHS